MLILDRRGTVWIKQPGSAQVDPIPFLELPDVEASAGQPGLISLALDPAFRRNGRYYVLYTAGSPPELRVTRFTARGSRTASAGTLVWRGGEGGASPARGTRLAVGPDGKLYIAISDLSGAQAQDLARPEGKILRVSLDGVIPADNPFVDGDERTLDEIWAYGLRDPSLSFDPISGRLYVVDAGGAAGERSPHELNLGEAGSNYGWPLCQGRCAGAGLRSPLLLISAVGRDGSIASGLVPGRSELTSGRESRYVAISGSGRLGRSRLDASARWEWLGRGEGADASGCLAELKPGPDGLLYFVDCGTADGSAGTGGVRRIRLTAAGEAIVGGRSRSVGTAPAVGAGRRAAYAFDETAGDTAADASGQGNTGFLTGATWTGGRFGNGLSFDGAESRVSVPDSNTLDITEELTLEAWINPRVLGDYRTIVNKAAPGQPTNYYLATSERELAFGFYTDGWREHRTGGLVLQVGVWQHVAATYSASADSVRLYVNGEPVLAGTETATLTANDQPLYIGRGSYSETFDGVIDEVQIYDRALSEIEIEQDMETPLVGSLQQAPMVAAGPDQHVVLPPGVAALDGTVSDDGLPLFPGVVTTRWTVQSGPAPVSFANDAAIDTTATFTATGTYVLRLSASDGELSNSDDIRMVVTPPNQAPAVSAGSSQSLSLPGVAFLDATVSDDGLPDPPARTAVTWRQVSGPGLASFYDAAAIDTAASFSAPGTYVLGLTAHDGELWTDDVVTVTAAGTPGAIFLRYSDLESGPNTGGEEGLGAIVTVWGMGFGATRGTSFVTVGGGPVARYASWSDTRIAFHLGAQARSGGIVVHTPGATSNALPFTVRAGDIYFVAPGGNDANAGTFSAPWATVVKAKNTMAAGDISYLMDGVQQAVVEDFGAALVVTTSGAPGRPKALVAYPGAIATIGSPEVGGGLALGVRVPNLGISATDWVLAGLRLRGGTAIDVGGMGPGSDRWRIVGNHFSCPNGDGPSGCVSIYDASHIKFLGNEVTDSGVRPASSKQYHAVYFTTDANHFEIGWNWIHDNRTCTAIQVHSSPVGPGTGFNQYDISIHDNTIHGDHCAGINLATVDPSKGRVEAYNNVIHDVGQPPGPPDGYSGANCVYVPGFTNAGAEGTGYVEVFNNTCLNAGTAAAGASAGAFQRFAFGPGLFLRLRNNVVYQLGSPYVAIQSDTSLIVGSHNLWFGAGAPPAWLSDNLATDPLFVNVATRDLHLRPDSPAVDAGIAPGVARDHDSNLRDTAPDLGAYELPGSATALQFFGSDVDDADKVYVPIDAPARPADVGDTDFTIEFWMRAAPGENPNVVDPGNNVNWIGGNIVFDRDINGSGDFGDFGIALGRERVAFGVSVGAESRTIVATTNVCDNAWHHVAVTRRRSDGEMRIYVDGVAEAIGDGPDGDASYRNGRAGSLNDPYLVMGGEKHGFNGLQYHGLLDEVRISSAIRYTNDFMRPTAPFSTDPSTVALYHFDEGAGNVLSDTSGAPGGPSPGDIRVGGTPPGPAWVISDVPWSGPTNQSPTAAAGPDQTLILPAIASLDGTAADDGLPNPPGQLTTTWSVASGPGPVAFSNPSAADTTATFSTPGTYLLRLTASDGALWVSDDVEILVRLNQAPAVNAGPDQTVDLPLSALLDGTVTDDGLPNPPATVTTTWSVVSATGAVTFGNASAVDTTASFSAPGTYVLRLQAFDGELTAADTVTFTVRPANQAPTVNAGADATISLPRFNFTLPFSRRNRLVLQGTVGDDGLPNPPGRLTTAWSQVSGPDVVRIRRSAQVDTVVRFYVPGTYVLRLTAFDGSATRSDDVVVTVLPFSPNGAPDPPEAVAHGRGPDRR